jgi:uncharacterized phage protein gp47/JayE
MTKDDFLKILLAAYDGPGSTEEGTFAGDVLRSCADGMAQLWSMDIDGLERRAFVSTAVGDWLTAVCADRGIPRKDGETDDELRERALRTLASTPASGNADHYTEWCTQVEDILRVRVLSLARGNGTVDIVAVGLDGKAASQEAVNQAQAIVDKERPVGADARVFAAVETPLDVSATVTLTDGADLGAVQTAFTAALTAFCRDNALRTTVVSFAKVLRLLLDCDGVVDVTGFTLCGGDESLTLGDRAVAVCGTLNLKGAGL